MSKEKTIWLKPLFFKMEVKVDINDVMDAMTKAIQQDHDIMYMQSVNTFMRDLYLQAKRENFKFETLEEEELFNQFIEFMKAKRNGKSAELNLKTL